MNFLNPLAPINYIMGGLFPDPSKAASPFLDKIPDELKKYFSPYIDAGQKTLPTWQNYMEEISRDPGAFFGKMGAGYQESPGYKFALGQALQGANQAAAAAGMAGSPQAQNQAAQIASNYANQDYYNYMDRVQRLLGTGLGGLGDISRLGAGAATGLGEDLASALGSQANLAYSGQANRNQMLGGLLGMLGSLGSAFL